MNRSPTSNCSIAKSLEIIGDPRCWLILRSSFFGTRTFDEFLLATLLSRNILSNRLKHLVKKNILRRVSYQDNPPRFQYRLTRMGMDIYGGAVLKMAWGDKWCPRKGGPKIYVHHTLCGSTFRPMLSTDSEVLELRFSDLDFQDGPGSLSKLHSLNETGYRRPSSNDLYDKGLDDSVARTLRAVGDRWSWLVLREVMYGTHRFDDILANLGIARNILADRLARLVTSRILFRQIYQERPDRFEYVFTERGADLQGSLLAMMAWGDHWLNSKSGPPVRVLHRPSHTTVHIVVRCAACMREAKAWDMQVRQKRGAARGIFASGFVITGSNSIGRTVVAAKEGRQRTSGR